MTKERLEQLKYIELSLENIRADIKKLNLQLANSKGKSISDVAKGSMPEHPYIECHYAITGVDMQNYDRLKRKLERRESDLQEKLCELEEWLDEIEDPKLYLIFRLKYRNGMTNSKIGGEVGYTGARVSQLISEYLKTN